MADEPTNTGADGADDENALLAGALEPHSPRAVADGVHWALDHPEATREELLDALLERIKGPDCPTGATILGHKGIEQSYRTRRCLITMRADGNTEEIKGELWETTMDPANRVLKQVHIEDALQADETFSMLMGDEVEPRRLFIQRIAHNARWIDA